MIAGLHANDVQSRPPPIPMNSREVAEDFVQRLKAIVDWDEIRLHSVSFDADLYDIQLTHGAWGMIVSLDKLGKFLPPPP